MKYLFLVRHGETDANKNRIVQGHLDYPLNATGQEQAKKAAELLSVTRVQIGAEKLDVPIDCIYSSPLKRAHATADAIRACHPEITQTYLLSDLKEFDFGELDGTPWDGSEFQDFLKAFESDIDLRVKGGETRREAGVRGVRALSEVLQHVRDGHGAIVVAHMRILCTTISSLTGMNIKLQNTECKVLGFPVQGSTENAQIIPFIGKEK